MEKDRIVEEIRKISSSTFRECLKRLFYRYSILKKSKREIYDSAYKIEVMETIYDILLEKIQSIQEELIMNIIDITNQMNLI